MACVGNRPSAPCFFTYIYIGRLRQLNDWAHMPSIMVQESLLDEAMMTTILVIERNPVVRKTVAHMVCMAGFRAVGAAQPDSALYAIKTMELGCLIALTKPSGQTTESFIELAKRLRPSLPIVLSRKIALMPDYRGLIAGQLDSPFYVVDLKNVLHDALSVTNV
jgi:CheY-like chemotaxis protein